MKHFNFSIFAIVLISSLTLSTGFVFGQAVSINSTGAAPHANAILDVSTTGTQGVLLARMTTATRTGWTPTTSGVTVYDTNTESYWYWDDTANVWREIPNMTSIPSVSLDDAYNGGIFITADAGAVDIQGAGGLTVNGATGLGTTSPDASYAATAATGNNTVKLASSSLGIRVEVQAGTEDGIYASNTSTSTANAFYAVRGELSGGTTANGYLGYHKSGGTETYAIYGIGGTYAGYFNGDVNLLGELQLNGSAGTSGQVLVSQGSGLDPIWGSAGVQSVTAGAGLDNSGTASAPVLDVLADNGLNIDAGQDRVQLGGDLTENTEIQLEAYNLTLDLNGTGEFIVQDANVDHFKIDAAGDAFFGSDTYFKDTNTGGTDLVKISDAGVGGNDGLVEVFANGVVSHTIAGDADTYFNQQGFDRNFRIDSDNEPNMFFVDGGTDRIGIGIGTPSRTLHVDGEARIQGLANAAGAVVISDANGNINDLAFTGTATDVLLGTGTFGPSSAFADHDWYQTTSTNTPTAIGDWIYTNGNVGINVGSTAGTLPLAALHAQSNAYIGDYNTAGFFNTNATLHIAKTNNPHLLLEDIANNTGGISFNTNGLHIATENGNIDFKTGVTYNGDFSSTGTARMTILNAGNVGIGTTAPSKRLELEVNESSGLNFPLFIHNPGAINSNESGAGIGFSADNSGNNVQNGLYFERNTDYSQGKFHVLMSNSGSATPASITTDSRLTILSNGNVGIGTTAPSYKFEVIGDATISGKFNSNGIQESSDKRFKKNINNLNGALENVLKIQGVTYDWRTEEFPERNFSSRTEVGVIAQDLEQIYPELVSTDSEGYKSVQYSHLVPVLIEAIKEQQKTIGSLEKTVENLTGLVDQTMSEYNELREKFSVFSAEISKMSSNNKSEEEKAADDKRLNEKLQNVGTPARMQK
ncbi:MAG: tail fiber domain-containing protein [Flavobacteriales bacterium]|nr:tail fiber domain-containing protein [Flavobacteriales bacterium]MCB9192705.1 tail fiber domain-containing protein [Flavobacteriales bacterium]MCB9205196.1 tail fiber domain-containing protein [Flavobacteriales bacterium]